MQLFFQLPACMVMEFWFNMLRVVSHSFFKLFGSDFIFANSRSFHKTLLIVADDISHKLVLFWLTLQVVFYVFFLHVRIYKNLTGSLGTVNFYLALNPMWGLFSWIHLHDNIEAHNLVRFFYRYSHDHVERLFLNVLFFLFY